MRTVAIPLAADDTPACAICGHGAFRFADPPSWTKAEGLLPLGFTCSFCNFAIRTAQEGLYDTLKLASHAQGNIEAVINLLASNHLPIQSLAFDYCAAIAGLVERQAENSIRVAAGLPRRLQSL